MAPGVELAAAYVSIIPTTKGIAQNLARELGDPAEKAANDAGRAIEEGIGGGAERGAQAAKLALSAIGSAAILSGLNRAKDAASGLQQAVGGTAAVFQGAAADIDAFAEGAADAIGLSERAARELTSQIGASLKGYGFDVAEAAARTIELTNLGSDLAATFGRTTADAVGALGSALRGEFDPLEAFGISLRQSSIDAEAVRLGLAESTTSVDAYGRAQAALSLILEQSADVQGATAREYDTAAAAAQRATANTENAAADLGEAILPIYAQISEGVADVASVFAALPEPVQTGILALAGVAAVAGPISNVVNLYRAFTPAVAANTAAVAANAAATNSAAAVQGLYAASTGRAALATGALTTALGLGATAFAGYAIGSSVVAESRRRATEVGSEFADQINSELSAVDTYAERAAILNQRIGEYNEMVDDANRGGISDIFSNDDLKEYTQQLGPALEAQRALNEVIAAYAEETGDADEATRILSGSAEEAALLLAQGYTPAAAAAELAVTARTTAERRGVAVTAEWGEVTEEAAAAAEDLATQIQAVHDNQLALVEGVLSGADAELAFQSAMIATSESIRALDEVYADSESSAADRQQAVIDATQTAIDQGDAAVAAAEAQNGDIALSAEEVARIQRDSLASVADNLSRRSPLRVNLEEYIARLDAVPAQIYTEIAAEIRLRNERFATLSPNFDASLLLTGAKPRAEGGPMVAGESYLFEGHPEILTMGPGMMSAQVTPLTDVVAPSSASGGVTQIFYGPVDAVEAGRQARKVQLVWS